MMLYLLLIQIGLLCMQDVAGQSPSLEAPADTTERLQLLYNKILSIAQPAGISGGPIRKRLVLIMPGKVLSFRDYFPGDEYIAFVKNPTGARFLEIPPIKQQNLFRLVDYKPGVDLLQGAESGESFSRTYEYILGQLDIRDFEKLSENQQKYQQEAVRLLIELVKDPENPDNEITRWDLYRRYESRYNEEKELMEEIIERERNSRSSIDYQFWFQRAYPTLQAKVDASFMDWLINGNKDYVELLRARLSASSIGDILYEAKAVLRATGVTALDRSGTIYPVEYTPGDWFEYLRDPVITLTPGQIQARLGQLKSQRNILNIIKDFNCDVSGSDLQTEADEASETLNTTSSDAMSERCKCIGDNNETACDQYTELLDATLDDLNVAATKLMRQQALEAIKSGDTTAVADMITSLDGQISGLEDQLQRSAGIPELAATATRNPLTDNWLFFEFYQSTESVRQETSTTTTSVSVNAGYNAGPVNAKIGVGYGRQTADAFNAMASSNINVVGQLLRVTVKYPWFRPELFTFPELTMKKATDLVSPGFLDTDTAFVTELNRTRYILPQYTAGILLCRNLTLTFTDMSSEQSSSMVSQSVSVSADVSYGPYSLQAAVSHGSTRGSFSADAVAGGLKIKVPGVQMIGYYIDVVPKFPIEE